MTDFVFGGMTRPPTVGGVPQAVVAGLIILALGAILAPIAMGFSLLISAGGVGMVVLLYLTARLLCETDHYTFRYLEIRLRVALAAPGRKLARGILTFAPAPLRKR